MARTQRELARGAPSLTIEVAENRNTPIEPATLAIERALFIDGTLKIEAGKRGLSGNIPAINSGA
jgi:hypothetical protein